MNLMQKKCLLWVGCSLATNLAILWALWSWRAGTERVSALRGPGAFWRPSCPLWSLWNQEQQRLAQRHASPSSSSVGGADRHCQPDPDVSSRFVDFPHLPRQMKDFLLYRRCRAYPLLLEPRGLCPGWAGGPPVLQLLLVIKSQVSSFARRQAIRQSWGGVGRASGVRLLFLLGQQQAADGHPNLTGLLGYESRRFGDLLQWAFRDTFFNLTLKEVLFLPWLARRCPAARYVFKGDDDVFVNTERLLDYVLALDPEKSRDLFLGDAILNAVPSRNPGLKYYVPGAFYSGLYPPYAGGAGVLYSGHLARRLAEASQAVPLFPIDDVYTGMCLHQLGLAPVYHEGFRSFGINVTDCWDPCAYRRIFMVHRRTPQEMVQLWKILHQPNITCK
ncbi:N-acetyllactosaminide beta-1,3-N-acetylglucosaminyltransferase 2-like [Heterodontus francisci]|uniref:N-acetyllactosaminide beta-1,3-N-acetylglucosaminyltransferase 2-like n=1 Tax=Heterodontus francisci TaxID=7792 RepID=UPI00355C655D